MSEFRDFDAAYSEAGGEPIRFRLGGEEFAARRPSLGPTLRLSSGLGSDGQAGLGDLANLEAFIRAHLGEDDHARWAAVLDRVPIVAVADVTEYLMEAGTGRPTQPPSDSPGRLRPIGRTSKADSSSPVTATSSAP